MQGGIRVRSFVSAALSAVLLLAGTACSLPEAEYEYPDEWKKKLEKTGGSVLGSEGGFSQLFKNKSEGESGGGGIGVNVYLWRATLDTVQFMPITNADPFGGVVITDWHTPSMAARNERFKLNVFILGRTLRADGVRVAVFRQALDASGGWRDAMVDVQAATGIEDAILTKARQLRNEALQQQ
jgi:hypothetical protein